MAPRMAAALMEEIAEVVEVVLEPWRLRSGPAVEVEVVVVATEDNSQLGQVIGTAPMEAAQIQTFLGGLNVTGA